MVVFNNLIPALFINATVQNPILVGNGPISTGGQLTFGHVLNGTFRSEPNFETPINGKLLYTNDFPTIDPDALHARFNFKGLIATDDGEYVEIQITTITTLTPAFVGITSGTTTGNLPFGGTQSVAIASFRTGAKKYKNLEDSIFVGSEAVKSIDGKTFAAGIKISKVVSSKTTVTLDQT